jgi:CRP/FNR family transcriptional regulator, cyclic AMP receptor protein
MEGVTKLANCRRFTILYTSGAAADSVFFLESGLVKILKREDAKEVLFTIVHPGEIFGEQAILLPGTRTTAAEVLHEASIYIVPRDLFSKFCNQRPEVWRLLSEQLAKREQNLKEKLELVLLKDVEQRIMLYLAELATEVGSKEPEGSGYSIQLSQGELASLIGATRETTSSMLNTLAKRGLVTLGRRKLIISSPEALRHAALRPRVQTAGS